MNTHSVFTVNNCISVLLPAVWGMIFAKEKTQAALLLCNARALGCAFIFEKISKSILFFLYGKHILESIPTSSGKTVLFRGNCITNNDRRRIKQETEYTEIMSNK
jgi:hypothetical protein